MLSGFPRGAYQAETFDVGGTITIIAAARGRRRNQEIPCVGCDDATRGHENSAGQPSNL
jgi:hypothetical protein